MSGKNPDTSPTEYETTPRIERLLGRHFESSRQASAIGELNPDSGIILTHTNTRFRTLFDLGENLAQIPLESQIHAARHKHLFALHDQLMHPDTKIGQPIETPLVATTTGKPLFLHVTPYPPPQSENDSEPRAELVIEAEELINERTQTVLDATPESITITNLDGTIIYENRGQREMFGSEQEAPSTLGMSVFELIDPEEHEAAFDTMQMALAGKPVRQRFTGIRKNGSQFPMELTVSTLLDMPEVPIAFIGVARDVTEQVQLEEDLKASKENYRLLLETLPFGFATHEIILNGEGIGTDYIFTEIHNPMFLEATGLAALGKGIEDAQGKRLSEVFEGMNIQNEEAITIDEITYTWPQIYGQIAMGERDSISFEQYSDGLERWYSVIAYSPKPGFFNVAFVDITEAKEREKLTLAIIPDAIIITYPRQRRFTTNPVFTNMFGCTGEDIRDTGLPSVEIEGLEKAVQKAMKRQGYVQVDTKAKDCNGTEIDVSLAIHCKGDECVISIRDITAMMNVDRAKDAFISNLSHEARTPLTSFNMRLYLLEKAIVVEAEKSTQREHIAVLQREADRLKRIIDDLRIFSTLYQDDTELSFTNTGLMPSIGALVTDRSLIAQNKGLELLFEHPEEEIHADVAIGLLEQAVNNLIINAINYTDTTGQIVVSIAQEGDNIQISVSDTGVGIHPDDMAHLFDRFKRGEGTAGMAEGTGLGLSIVKEIVTKHHGTINVESPGILGKGSTFTMTIPVSQGIVPD